MNAGQTVDTTPWYRQRWPWLVMLPPAVAVVGCIITIPLAIRSAGDHATLDVDAVIYAAPAAQVQRVFGLHAASLVGPLRAIERFRYEPITTIYLKYDPAEKRLVAGVWRLKAPASRPRTLMWAGPVRGQGGRRGRGRPRRPPPRALTGYEDAMILLFSG